MQLLSVAIPHHTSYLWKSLNFKSEIKERKIHEYEQLKETTSWYRSDLSKYRKYVNVSLTPLGELYQICSK